MTVTISAITNGQRTFTYTKTAASQKVLDVAEYAAHHLFDLGFGDHGTDGTRLYSALGNAEKIDLLDAYLTRTLRLLAHDYYVPDAENTARITAEASTNFDLGV